MLTSYFVSCPHLGCDWFGSLLPQGDSHIWRGSVPTVRTVRFECPQCHGEWQARIDGDDIKPLPLEELALPWA